MARTTDTPAGSSVSPDATPAAPNTSPVDTGVTLEQDQMVTVGDETENPERPPMKDLKGVRYSGVADRKIFTAEDLAKLGATNIQTGLEWNKDNGFLVSITDLNASTVDALIKLPGFTAV